MPGRRRPGMEVLKSLPMAESAQEALHLAFDPGRFRWQGVEAREYKESEGKRRGMGWRGLSRHTLVPGGSVAAGFEQRYFEIEPGGYSSLEKHEHAHVVVTLRGKGRVLVGDRVVELGHMEVLEIPSSAPHRWVNAGEEPWGFLCTVDVERDRPQPLDDAEWEALKADPVTAPFIF
jgi:quercetin dioxygenase-like cupin family protein